MNESQIENIYFVNGIGDFQLRNLGDLMKIHGINARTIEGFSELSEDDKKSYETFILKVMNSMGMMSRITFTPEKVYRAYDVNFLIKNNDDDSYKILGGEVWNISTSKLTITRKWKDEELEKNIQGIVLEEKSKEDYLRIEFSYGNRKEWLHIIKNGEEWF